MSLMSQKKRRKVKDQWVVDEERQIEEILIFKEKIEILSNYF